MLVVVMVRMVGVTGDGAQIWVPGVEEAKGPNASVLDWVRMLKYLKMVELKAIS